MFAWVRRLLPSHAVPRSPAVTPEQVNELRQQIADVRAWLAEVEAKLDRSTLSQPKAAPLTTDEYIERATSATQVYKALEPELGVDRRTILARVERIVRAHGFAESIPDWGTSLVLAKHLAGRTEDGTRRIVAAIAELDTPVGAGA
jgi:hypothetical protein